MRSQPGEALSWALALAGLVLAARMVEEAGLLHGGHEEPIVLSLVALAIVFSGQLAHATGLPAAVVEILAGLGLAWAGASRVEVLKVLAGIGANIVLFMAGTEVDVSLIRRRIRQAGEAAILALAGAALLGLAVSWTVGAEGPGTIILVAGLSATSAALTYAILQAAGLVRGRRGQVALAAAMITDVVGMILLNVATSGANPLLILYAPILLAAVLLQPLLPRLGERGFEAELRLILMAVIVLGSLSEIIGVHSVLTSFILGVVVADTVQSRRMLREKLEGLATGFFTPFFFVASGMSVDVKVLAADILLVLAAGAAAFAAKFLPLLAYFKQQGAGRGGVLYAASLSPLLTVTIIAAQVGLDQGLLDSRAAAILTGSVVFTSLAASMVALAVSRRSLEVHRL